MFKITSQPSCHGNFCFFHKLKLVKKCLQKLMMMLKISLLVYDLLYFMFSLQKNKSFHNNKDYNQAVKHVYEHSIINSVLVIEKQHS